MTRKLTKAELVALHPCELDERLDLFGKSSALTVRQAFNRGFTTRDLLWVAGELGLKAECASFARECADRVKHFKGRRAAAAAYATAAAYAAAAAAAYADASYASYAAAAADAAAAAAAAAAYAAAAAAAAAYAAAARKKEVEAQKKIFIRIFG